MDPWTMYVVDLRRRETGRRPVQLLQRLYSLHYAICRWSSLHHAHWISRMFQVSQAELSELLLATEFIQKCCNWSSYCFRGCWHQYRRGKYRLEHIGFHDWDLSLSTLPRIYSFQDSVVGTCIKFCEQYNHGDHLALADEDGMLCIVNTALAGIQSVITSECIYNQLEQITAAPSLDNTIMRWCIVKFPDCWLVCRLYLVRLRAFSSPCFDR